MELDACYNHWSFDFLVSCDRSIMFVFKLGHILFISCAMKPWALLTRGSSERRRGCWQQQDDVLYIWKSRQLSGCCSPSPTSSNLPLSLPDFSLSAVPHLSATSTLTACFSCLSKTSQNVTIRLHRCTYKRTLWTGCHRMRLLICWARSSSPKDENFPRWTEH